MIKGRPRALLALAADLGQLDPGLQRHAAAIATWGLPDPHGCRCIPEERKRNERAHHHKGHFKKDFTRDDTLDEPPVKPGNPSPAIRRRQAQSGQSIPWPAAIDLTV
jgi:hypothetical protein